MKNASPGIVGNMSGTGWSNSVSLCEERDEYVLILDGHISHLPVGLMQVPANTSHFPQTLDVA